MKKRNPRHGSMQFWPRVKAKRAYARIRRWNDSTKGVLGFAGYKVGMTHLMITDNKATSKTKGEVNELFIGEDNYVLVKIPPLVWNGFKGLGDEMSIVANCATIAHDPEEIERIDSLDPLIPYNWEAELK